MDEDQENVTAMTSEEKEKNYKDDVRRLVEIVQKEEMELEMMQKEEMEQEKQRGRVAPNMGAGGSHLQATSGPQEEDEGRDGQTVKTMKGRRKKNKRQKEKGGKRRKKRKSKRRRKRQCQKQGTRS